MSSPPDDRMDALSEAIAGVLRRLDKIEARLSRLEDAQGITEVPQRSPREQASPEPAAVEPASVPEPEPRRVLETRVGLTWINRVGVLTLVLAVAFFFKYAVDNQWIGEAGRVVLGVLAGFAALGLAEWMWRRGHGIYAQGITGAGIAILYLSFYASFSFYHLLGQGPAFLLLALTTAIAVALAIRYDAAAISILGLVGGYLTPLLLSTGEDRAWVLFGYVLLLDGGAMAVARSRRWRRLEGVAFTGTAILYGAWFLEHFTTEKQLVATVYALAYYALFGLAAWPAVFVTSQVLVNVAILAIWPAPEIPYLLLSLAVVVAGLAISERRAWSIVPLASFGAFWSCFALWQSSLSRPLRLAETLLALTAGFLLFLGWFAWRILVKGDEARKQDLIVVAFNGTTYFGICYHLLQPDYGAYLGLFAAALGCIHLWLGIELRKSPDRISRDMRPVLLCMGVAVGFLTLAVPIQLSGYRVTVGWALEAGALVWIGVRTGSKRLVYAAMLVFLLTLCRLYAIDAWIYHDAAYRAITNVRFLTFFVSAVCLWLSARWISSGLMALAAYVVGHFVMVWALVAEVLGWAARSASPENVANLGTVSVSVLMAAYGVALVGLGVLAGLRLNRVLGLGLLAVVVLKLYIHDVWQLGRIYRVIAFGLLGVLLLITSFLYSRYRTAIENWWRDHRAGNPDERAGKSGTP